MLPFLRTIAFMLKYFDIGLFLELVCGSKFSQNCVIGVTG